jgi:hypothetical protein
MDESLGEEQDDTMICSWSGKNRSKARSDFLYFCPSSYYKLLTWATQPIIPMMVQHLSNLLQQAPPPDSSDNEEDRLGGRRRTSNSQWTCYISARCRPTMASKSLILYSRLHLVEEGSELITIPKRLHM